MRPASVFRFCSYPRIIERSSARVRRYAMIFKAGVVLMVFVLLPTGLIGAIMYLLEGDK
jgi:hypothetical protein